MKHTSYDLAQMQSLPLEAKIRMTKQRIQEWYEAWEGMVYVSFSGGKDSTVLKHIVDSMYDDVPSLFINTGLEFPEIQRFVRDVKDGKYDCFNTDVEIVRPEMRFDEVIKTYGYPVISKEVSQIVEEAKIGIKRGDGSYAYRLMKLNGTLLKPDGTKSQFNCEKWRFMLDADYDISDKCCKIMKKKPAKSYEKQSKRKPYIGSMASESKLRYQQWIRYGCNSFDKKRIASNPLAFWTEQDILHYIKDYKVPYCSVYGDIVTDNKSEDALEGQVNLIDYLECNEETDVLKTTGCSRTGCVFCCFGCHLEKEPNRFQQLKETHPRQWEYCIGGGEYVWEAKYRHPFDGEWSPLALLNDDGTEMTNEQVEEWAEKYKDDADWMFTKKWQPSKDGLGLAHVLDYIGVKY